MTLKQHLTQSDAKDLISTYGTYSGPRNVSVRTLRELAPVLYDRNLGTIPLDLPAYYVFRDCCDKEKKHLLWKHELRYDVTVIPPLVIGEEYGKTFGHYHQRLEKTGHSEIFEVIQGKAGFLLQSQSESSFDVSLRIAEKGDKVVISPDMGHVLVNLSPIPLVVGNLISLNCIQEYDKYLRRNGAAFYVLKNMRLSRNPRYPLISKIQVPKGSNVPPSLGGLELLETFVNHPDRFTFLCP